jgi:hypothetical protein
MAAELPHAAAVTADVRVRVGPARPILGANLDRGSAYIPANACLGLACPTRHGSVASRAWSLALRCQYAALDVSCLTRGGLYRQTDDDVHASPM